MCLQDVKDADLHILQAVVECSARRHTWTDTAVQLAVKAVVYPTAPLYDFTQDRLKPLAVKALKRVFLLCDQDEVCRVLLLKERCIPCRLSAAPGTRPTLHVDWELHVKHDSSLFTPVALCFLVLVSASRCDAGWRVLSRQACRFRQELRRTYSIRPANLNAPPFNSRKPLVYHTARQKPIDRTQYLQGTLTLVTDAHDWTDASQHTWKAYKRPGQIRTVAL